MSTGNMVCFFEFTQRFTVLSTPLIYGFSYISKIVIHRSSACYSQF
jgi:hypothetical protein